MYIELAERVGYVPGGTNVGVIRIDDRRVLLVDSGLNDGPARKVLRVVRDELGSEVVAILNTHGHADHFGANSFVVKRTACTVSAPAIEATIIAHPILQAAFLYGGADPVDALRSAFLVAEASPVDGIVEIGTHTFHGVTLDVMPLPGHSPNQVGYLVDGVLFSADVLFPQAAITKYRIPYLYGLTDHLASIERLNGIRASWIVPGHGPAVREVSDLVDLNREAIDATVSAVIDATEEPASGDEVTSTVLAAREAPVSDAQGYYLLRPTIAAYLAHLHRIGEVGIEMQGSSVLWRRI
jgi:glyoxylase-like metal-dependent hydrolase (beta-lactamase superfamily II)